MLITALSGPEADVSVDGFIVRDTPNRAGWLAAGMLGALALVWLRARRQTGAAEQQ